MRSLPLESSVATVHCMMMHHWLGQLLSLAYCTARERTPHLLAHRTPKLSTTPARKKPHLCSFCCASVLFPAFPASSSARRPRRGDSRRKGVRRARCCPRHTPSGVSQLLDCSPLFPLWSFGKDGVSDLLAHSVRRGNASQRGQSLPNIVSHMACQLASGENTGFPLGFSDAISPGCALSRLPAQTRVRSNLGLE